jgi:hypothetical protein
MKKVHPTDGLDSKSTKNDYQGGKTSKILLAVFTLVGLLSKIGGISPYQVDHANKTIKFEWFSVTTFVSLLCVFIFNLPFMVLPHIFDQFGFDDEEIKQLGSNSTVSLQDLYNKTTTQLIMGGLDYFSNYALFIVPFVLAHLCARPSERIYQMITSPKNEDMMACFNGKAIFTPMICFVLFIIGKSVKVIAYLPPETSSQPFIMFAFLSHFIYSSLGLQFWLATSEFYLYYFFNWHGEFARRVLDTPGTKKLLNGAEELIYLMENIHQAYSLFLLFDFSLMLLYWLIHLYIAYFAYQVPLSFLGSVLIILAELCRVVLLSCTCGGFTDRTEEVIGRLEETRAAAEDGEERRVGRQQARAAVQLLLSCWSWPSIN